MTKPIHRPADPDWLRKLAFSVRHQGVAVLTNMLSDSRIADLMDAVTCAKREIEAVLGASTLHRIREEGRTELRLPMKYDERFLRLLEDAEILSIVDVFLGNTAVLRFMNVDVIPADAGGRIPRCTTAFHMNTPRCMPGYIASLEVVLALTPLDFLAVPGSHQKPERPEPDLLEWCAEHLRVPAGGILVFDSTLWHREIATERVEASVVVELQFTRSFIKPHFDYPRALGEECLRSLPERTRQLLGWHTRLPASLEEFYLTGEERLYQPGQG